MSGLFGALVNFIPNLITHYERKDLTKSSEFWAGAVGVLGAVNASQNWVDVGSWNNIVAPALVYAGSRILSKGLSPHPASVAQPTPPPPAAS